MIEICTKSIDDVWFGVAYEEKRVFATAFAATEQAVLRCLLNHLPFEAPFEVTSARSTFSEKILLTMKKVYDGKVVSEVCFATEHLPAYTQRVLQAVYLIPVGYVTSYGALAKVAGGSARAVGNVMAANPFALVVPCHRVVRANFTLGGYSGGLNVKMALLKREQRGYREKRKISVHAGMLVVFPVEFVLRKQAP